MLLFISVGCLHGYFASKKLHVIFLAVNYSITLLDVKTLKFFIKVKILGNLCKTHVNPGPLAYNANAIPMDCLITQLDGHVIHTN